MTHARNAMKAFVGIAAAALMMAACDRMLEPAGSGPPQTPRPTPNPGETSGSTPDVVATPTPQTPPSPVQSATPEPEDTATPAPTPQETPSPAPSETATPEPTPEPSPEATPTPTPSAAATPEVEPAFYYYPPGDLEENSGQGVVDATIYVPDMVFPIKDAAAHPQSQVYRFGGGVAGGDQCDPRNFTYPWRDNYCEKRSTNNGTPYCPVHKVHLGQDIRVGTPEGCNAERRTASKDRKRYAVVAAEDGQISNVGRYTVNVRAGGRIYRYMHMNMQALEVALGQSVKAGDVLGYVSNDFGGTPTTLHLHFEIKHNTAEHGWTWAPPYTSLIAAYERREGAPGRLVTAAEAGGDVVVASE